MKWVKQLSEVANIQKRHYFLRKLAFCVVRISNIVPNSLRMRRQNLSCVKKTLNYTHVLHWWYFMYKNDPLYCICSIYSICIQIILCIPNVIFTCACLLFFHILLLFGQNFRFMRMCTMDICVYMWMFLWLCVCVCVCVCARRVRTFTCVRACMHACMHACVWVLLFVCLYVCMYICMCV